MSSICFRWRKLSNSVCREIYMNTQQAEALGVDVFRDVCSRRPCGAKRTDRDVWLKV